MNELYGCKAPKAPKIRPSNLATKDIPEFEPLPGLYEPGKFVGITQKPSHSLRNDKHPMSMPAKYHIGVGGGRLGGGGLGVKNTGRGHLNTDKLLKALFLFLFFFLFFLSCVFTYFCFLFIAWLLPLFLLCYVLLNYQSQCFCVCVFFATPLSKSFALCKQNKHEHLTLCMNECSCCAFALVFVFFLFSYIVLRICAKNKQNVSEMHRKYLENGCKYLRCANHVALFFVLRQSLQTNNKQ